MEFPYPIHTAFVVFYLLVLVGLGAWKAGKIKSQEDFSLAGRGLGSLVLVGTLLATWIGTGSIFGNAQKTYQLGLGAFILPLGGLLGILVLARLAFRIREFAGFSVQDILDARFGRGARYLGTLTLVLAYVIIVSYQYRAGSAVLERLVPALAPEQGAHPYLPTIIVAFFVIAYTALAGMVSVAYTDLANGILISVGILVAVPILYFTAGSWSGIQETLAREDLKEVASLTNAWKPLNIINWCLPAFLLILGDANMYQRFFSAKSPAVAKRSALYLILGIAVLETAIIAAAFLGRILVEQGALAAPANPAHIVVSLAFDILPALLGAILMGTIIAVVVSTADSFLLAPATALVRDFTRNKSKITPARQVVLSRLIVVIFGVVALGLAFTSEKFFEVALFAYTVYGASVTPVLLAAFFWRRATKAGAVASMSVGITVAIGWQWLVFADYFTDPLLTGIDAVLPSLVMACLALVIVSLLTRPSGDADFEANA